MAEKSFHLSRRLQALTTGEHVSIHGSGEAERDFIHVDDVAKAYTAAINKNIRGTLKSGQAINFAKEVLRIAENQTGKTLNVHQTGKDPEIINKSCNKHFENSVGRINYRT